MTTSISCRSAVWTFALLLSALSSGGCAAAENSGSGPTIDLTGAGATFPYPIVRDWIAEYAAREQVRVNYMSVGSAEGLRLVAAGEVDFGTSDYEPTVAPDSSGCRAVSVPVLVGAIAVVYRLPELGDGIRLDRETLRRIFAGQTTRWNAPEIARLNPSVRMPSTPIVVVHRGVGSATGRLFAHYLSGRPGLPETTQADPVWPVGISAEGNEGVAAQVQQTAGSIGYVELAYAGPSGLAVALVENAKGEFARPTLATLNATVAAAFAGKRDASGTSLLAVPASGTYPIAAITWLTFNPGRLGPVKGRRVAAFARWAMQDGAVAARRLESVPLPPAVVTRYDSVLSAEKYQPCPAG